MSWLLVYPLLSCCFLFYSSTCLSFLVLFFHFLFIRSVIFAPFLPFSLQLVISFLRYFILPLTFLFFLQYLLLSFFLSVIFLSSLFILLFLYLILSFHRPLFRIISVVLSFIRSIFLSFFSSSHPCPFRYFFPCPLTCYFFLSSYSM